ncbi:MAG: cysteine synthase family protein [Gammaproteobacteria bacterium]|nr:MAG: cysteine synthase family protein [Gammaproteobacteria bacterium]
MRSVECLAALVGQTPLLEIRYRLGGRRRRLYAKFEVMNMTGSVKDRMALHILRRAQERGELKDGDVIVEATSGNTGISFSALGRALGHRVRIYMPDWMSHERVHLMHSLGAEVIPVAKSQGGFVGSIALTREYAAENANVYLPRQFDNPDNVEAHELMTGPEIETQLARFGVKADAFIAGVGTGGTVMGVGRYLRRDGRKVRVHPLEPANSPTLRTGKKVGSHRIQGISDEFIPSIVKLDQLDAVVDVWDGDAILMSQALCHRIGLGVGISAGANIVGAIKLGEELGDDAVVVTVICDSNKKYLSTALAAAEPPQDDYITPQVQLDSFISVR